jgi:hypothetical protein
VRYRAKVLVAGLALMFCMIKFEFAGAESNYAGANSFSAYANSNYAGANSFSAGAESNYAGANSFSAYANSFSAGANSNSAGAKSNNVRTYAVGLLSLRQSGT